MEKAREQRGIKSEEAKSRVWDCGSSLYDSFELKSFKRQLDSAISSRTLSMPRLPDRRAAPPPPPPPPVHSKKSSKISRSFHKLLKSVFGSKTNSSSLFRVEKRSQNHFYGRDMSEALTTIPEVPDFDYAGLSPENDSFVKRSASERFTATSIGIYVA